MTTGTSLTTSNINSKILVLDGGSLTLTTNNITAYNLLVDQGGTLSINSGRTLTVNSGADLMVNGTLVNSGTLTNNGTMLVGATGTYQHNIASLAIPVATWDPTSTLYITGITGGTLTGTNRNLGNVIIDCNLTTELFFTTSSSTVVYGDFNIVKTSTAATNGSNHLCWAASGTTTADIRGSLRLESTGTNYAAFEPFHTSGYTVQIGGGYHQSAVSGGSGIGYWESGTPTFTIKFTGTGVDKTISGSLVAGTTSTSTTINYVIDAGASYTLSDNTSTGITNLTSTISVNGTLDMADKTLVANSAGTTAFVMGTDGLLKVGGASNFPSGFDTTTTTSGTVEYSRSGDQAISGRAYNNLTLSGSGIKTLGGSTSVAGNWTNSGVTLAGNYTVTLNGSSTQTIVGDNTWYSLTATGGNRSLLFESGKTQAITSGGSLSLAGTAGNLLTVSSTTGSSAWNLSFNGATKSVNYINLSWSDASSGQAMTANNSTNSGNNLNWIIPTVPTLSTPTVTSIGTATATMGATVTSNGDAALTARGTCWRTSALPTLATGTCVAEGGTAVSTFSHARASLTPTNTKIYYNGYATNSVGTGYSSDGSFYLEPTTQASNVTFSAISATGMTVGWTRGTGGAGVIVVLKAGSAVDTNPADGTYSAYNSGKSTVFGSAYDIGNGNRVVYMGTGTSVVVTGLTFGTTYHVAVYEYAGTGDASGYNSGINYKLSPATGNKGAFLSQVGSVTGWTKIYAASPNATSVNVTTSSFTAGGTAGTGRVMLVALEANAGTTGLVTSKIATNNIVVKYGGVTVNRITGSDVNILYGTHLWLGYVLDANIPTGANTVTVQFTSSVTTTALKVFAATFSGVNQTTPTSYSGYRGRTSTGSAASAQTATYGANDLPVLLTGNGSTTSRPTISSYSPSGSYSTSNDVCDTSTGYS